jgi:hypothetical protein
MYSSVMNEDALREQSVDFHLESVVDDPLDLALPLLVLEPVLGGRPVTLERGPTWQPFLC